MYCRKEMVKILKCYLIPKKNYGTLSKGAIFFSQPSSISIFLTNITHKCIVAKFDIYLHHFENCFY